MRPTWLVAEPHRPRLLSWPCAFHFSWPLCSWLRLVHCLKPLQVAKQNQKVGPVVGEQLDRLVAAGPGMILLQRRLHTPPHHHADTHVQGQGLGTWGCCAWPALVREAGQSRHVHQSVGGQLRVRNCQLVLRNAQQQRHAAFGEPRNHSLIWPPSWHTYQHAR